MYRDTLHHRVLVLVQVPKISDSFCSCHELGKRPYPISYDQVEIHSLVSRFPFTYYLTFPVVLSRPVINHFRYYPPTNQQIHHVPHQPDHRPLCGGTPCHHHPANWHPQCLMYQHRARQRLSRQGTQRQPQRLMLRSSGPETREHPGPQPVRRYRLQQQHADLDANVSSTQEMLCSHGQQLIIT